MLRRKDLVPLSHPDYQITKHQTIQERTEHETVQEENEGTRTSIRLKGKQKLLLVNSEESGSEDDDDFEHKEDNCKDLLDDIVFDENIDMDAEWVGSKFNGSKNTSSCSSMDDDANDENDSSFESVDSDDVDDGGIGREARMVFRASSSNNPKFELALKVKNEEEFQIREMDLEHSCARVYQVDNANSRWLAKRFENKFRCDPGKSIKGFRKSVTSELGISVSPYQAYRGKAESS